MNIRALYPVLMLALSFSACSSDSPTLPPEPKPDFPDTPAGQIVTVTSSLDVALSTDKAVYRPGETVTFTTSAPVTGAKIRYRQGSRVVAETPMTSRTWQWTPPATDYQGYMVDVYEPGTGTETVRGTIAVDVSSDWTRFPRYGFVATFDGSKLADGVIDKEMAFLKRCHINGVQFQDWHWKHHWPLGGTRDNPLEEYTDIALRTVNKTVVERYIAAQHALGMKSIFYNLCFGALDDAAKDGVKEEWYLFKNASRGDKDCHPLPFWKSNIYLLDPANSEWQRYIGDRNDDVYAVLDFDGYQVDQLGDRGTLYDYDGIKVNLPNGYLSFLKAMKARHPDKRLVMNSVANFGAMPIASSGVTDFCYTEMWDGEASFDALHSTIKGNDGYSGHKLWTVFAAYMNYNHKTPQMNLPGVVMADAVMMALGGSHLELGDHMLCSEYFPSEAMTMGNDVREAMVRYYDFMTGYQNYLRGVDTKGEFAATLTSDKAAINAWPPRQKALCTYSKALPDGTAMINLLNFMDIDNLSWRDMDSQRRAPRHYASLPLTLTWDKPVQRIWTASPDRHAGAPEQLAFTQSGNKVTFTLPALDYWAMIVIE